MPPAPAPTPKQPSLAHRLIAVALIALFPIALGALVGVEFGGKPGPKPTPASPTLAAAAKAYAGTGPLAVAKAEGWRAAALAIRGGGSVKLAQDTEAGLFKTAATADFEKLVKAELVKAAPLTAEGADPATPAARTQLADALEAMAQAVDPQAKAAYAPPITEEGAGVPVSQLNGWIETPARIALAASLPNRTLSDAAPAMVGADPPKDVFLYKAWSEVLGKYPDYPAQQIGDCTSFGSGHVIDLLQCIDIALNHGTADQYRETSTEVIYGLGREVGNMLGRGDGCYGVAVAKGLTDYGAVTREAVGPYSGTRAKQFGRSGVPQNFKDLAKDHKLGSATLVTTLAEADAAIGNGYPFIVCSNQGFTMTRDSTGLCEAKGRWPHCMNVIAARTLSGERQYCIGQSWGSQTPSGPLSDDQPPNSFWCRGRVMASMLAAQDSLAFSKFAGFVARPIPDRWTYSGFARPAPASKAPSKAPRKKAA